MQELTEEEKIELSRARRAAGVILSYGERTVEALLTWFFVCSSQKHRAHEKAEPLERDHIRKVGENRRERHLEENLIHVLSHADWGSSPFVDSSRKRILGSWIENWQLSARGIQERLGELVAQSARTRRGGRSKHRIL